MQKTEPGVWSKRKASTFWVTLALAALFISLAGTHVAQASTNSSTVVVTDGLGRTVELTTPIRRVVISYPIATELLFALGGQDTIVGIDSPSQKSEFLNSLKPNLATTICVGGPRDLNIEQAIALEPDLWLISRSEELVEGLEARGIKNIFAVKAEDLDQLRSSMENLGKAFGKEEQAKVFTSYYDKTLETVAEIASDLKEEEKPLVYVVGRDGLLSTCGTDMYQQSVIDLVGGRNAGASEEVSDIARGWFTVSPEQIIKWDPDFILVVQYAADVTPEDVLNDPRFQGVSAVRNKRVFWFPSNLQSWDYPSPQAVLGVKWLAQLLHPDKFVDFDVEKDADELFLSLYGKSFTELGGTF
ncbi:MAG: ABC transporter substrate-binding protein [Firmicutes bacterium]|nr:ABC transporter substrate-binding protein [Bacillota bacterium]